MRNFTEVDKCECFPHWKGQGIPVIRLSEFYRKCEIQAA